MKKYFHRFTISNVLTWIDRNSTMNLRQIVAAIYLETLLLLLVLFASISVLQVTCVILIAASAFLALGMLLFER